MDRQIRRDKGKVYRTEQARRKGRTESMRGLELAVVEADRQEIESDDLQPTAVVRTKRFPMKPMTVEDTVLEMELLSHNFFFFQQRRHRGVQHGIPQA